MKTIMLTALLLLSSTVTFANDNKVCQKCHPLIYKEYYSSIHRKSSLANDKIYNALFHKEFANTKDAKCNSCHAPSAKTTTDEKETPISCIYCHTIKNIQEHAQSNKNILTGKKKDFYSAEADKRNESGVKYKTTTSFFGLIKRSKNSPYHKIEYNNENYYNGNVCMGCHSHANNAHGFDTIMLDAYIDKKDKHTCISCHMPQIMGSKTTLRDTKTHAFHGIAGIHNLSESLEKYIDFTLTQATSGFKVTITNQANHALFGQAYREGVLEVSVTRKGKTTSLKPYIFTRVFGNNGTATLPFEATDVIKDTLIYAKKVIPYKMQLKHGDSVTLTLGFRLLSKQAAEALQLDNDKTLTEIKILKTQTFHF